MSNLLQVLLPGLAGMILGGIFFGGLWWTVKRGLQSKNPAKWFLLSLMVRIGITLAGFYFVGKGHAERMVACLVGFILARFIVDRMTISKGGKSSKIF
jgi:F1F0 ATPase subunit 2